MSLPRPKSVGEIDSFVTMLLAACEDKGMNGQLEKILSLPDVERKNLVYTWISDLLIAEAPRDFIAAVACLADDAVAEKAYEVIHHCKREAARQ